MSFFLFGTSNSGKIIEARAVCDRFGVRIAAPYEITAENFSVFGLKHYPGMPPDVQEVCSDYLGNARLKAREFLNWSGLPSISDDSGLEVEALDGGPGIMSARFAGDLKDFDLNIEKLLMILKKCENRRACFRSVICCLSAGKEWVAEGVVTGAIGFERQGYGGFGYDSVFVVDGYGKTLSQLKDEGVAVKTHRILALEHLLTAIVQ